MGAIGLAGCGDSLTTPTPHGAPADQPAKARTVDVVAAVGPFDVEGSKMLADPRDEVITPWLKKGVWEPVETALFRSEIHAGDVVVDVGANVGYFTLIASQLVGDTGQVWAFEPDPDAFDLLRRNVELNGYKNVNLVPKALGAEPGTLKLFRHATNRGDHRVYDPGDGREAVDVEVTTLDKVFTAGTKIDVIKIDTQGAECAVAAGASKTLERGTDMAVIMEYTPHYIRQMGQDPQQCLRTIEGYGFSFYEIREFAPPKGVFKTDIEALQARYSEAEEDYTNLFLPSRADVAKLGPVQRPR